MRAGIRSLGKFKLWILRSSFLGFVTRTNVAEIAAMTSIFYSTSRSFIEVPLPYAATGLNNFISNTRKLFFVEIHFDLA